MYADRDFLQQKKERKKYAKNEKRKISIIFSRDTKYNVSLACNAKVDFIINLIVLVSLQLKRKLLRNPRWPATNHKLQ
jgi:hypothetical protein